jgi:hypothetical protein
MPRPPLTVLAATLATLAAGAPAQAKGSDAERVLVNTSGRRVYLRPDRFSSSRQSITVTVKDARHRTMGLEYLLNFNCLELPAILLEDKAEAHFLVNAGNGKLPASDFHFNFKLIANGAGGILSYGTSNDEHPHAKLRIRMSLTFPAGDDPRNAPSLRAEPEVTDRQATRIELKDADGSCVIL